MTEQTDVLVVGAGPTGLTLAAGLLRRGVRVRLLDRADHASPHSKAITLWPVTLETFERLGVGQRVYDQAVKINATNYYSGDRLVGRVAMRPMSGTRFPRPLSLPQTTTEQILRQAVTRLGGRIEFGRAVTAFEQQDGGVRVHLDDGGSIDAGWLIGCDGAHSTVRAAAGIEFIGSTYPQTFMLVDGEFDTDYAHDESYYVMGRSGVMVVAGLPGGLYRFFVSVAADRADGDPASTVPQLIDEISPRRARLVRVAGAGTFQVHRKLAATFLSGRVLLAGDAAHIHSPAGGLGLNTGVQDAGALAWRLAAVVRGELPETELDLWDRERRFVGARVVAEADQQTRMWMLRGWRRVLRDAGIALGLRTGLLERILPRRMAQLDLTLPGAGQGTRRLPAGRRVPDLVLESGAGLHDLLAAGDHVLLTFDHKTLTAVPATAEKLHRLLVVLVSPATDGDLPDVLHVADPHRRIRRALGVSRGTVCLIRPDGVLAGTARADGLTTLLTAVPTRTGEPAPLPLVEGHNK
ncbi:FAD-dependent monooxygenase [Actinoplanes sp. N902-109]|uniref:FAD-dependent monooxygenase n=1 Tax=Actinoplanes sp. (strain N902-109) TaxID=649831 RepID=UPI00032951F8|nr:FAD-dependent monooxygenase [Actinoplanes sp. N902-109]AGL13746.1 putative monooxygenase [Actinoplanes sp. N902-109]